MPQDLLSPDEFGQMLDDPEFAKLPFDTRKTYVEKGIGEASRFIAERDGGWTPERWQNFGAAAQQARQFVSESETAGETVMRYAGVAGQTIKDLPAIIGTGVAGLSPVLPDGSGGITGQVPGETLGPALGRNLVGLAASGAAMLSDAEQPMVKQIDTLKQKIDQGEFLTHEKGFQGWMDEQNTAVREKQKAFYQNEDWADQNSLLGSAENVKLMQDYLTTRSPQSWAALQDNLLRTPFRAKLQADQQALENDTKLGRALAPEARPLISEAADPAELLPGMLAVKKGVQIATQGASAGSRALDAAKGIAGEMLGEQVSATIDNPYLSAAERLQVAKDSLAGSLGLMGVGAGAKAAVQALSPSTINSPPSTNDPLPPNQTPAPAGTPQAPGTTPGAAPLAGAAGPVPSTLSRIAQESLVADLPEDTGALTAEEVADLEVSGATFQVSSSNPLPTVANPDPAQTITGSNVQMGTEMPVPSPTAQAGAGAGAMVAAQPVAAPPNELLTPELETLPPPPTPQAAPPAQTDAQPVVPELLTPAQLQSYGQAQDIANAQARLDAAMAAQDRGAAELAMMTLTGAKAGSGPLATRAVRAQDEAVTLAILSARPVDAVAMERWAQYPETNEIGPDGNLKRRGIPAKYAKQGDVYVHAEAEQTQDTTIRRGLQNLQGGNRSNAGSTTLPSEAADALINLANAAVRAGQTFAQWATSMLQRFGEAVRQYLQGAWQAAMRTSEVGAINPQGTGKRGGAPQADRAQRINSYGMQRRNLPKTKPKETRATPTLANPASTLANALQSEAEVPAAMRGVVFNAISSLESLWGLSLGKVQTIGLKLIPKSSRDHGEYVVRGHIALNDNLSDAQLANTAVHEFAHHLHHAHTPGSGFDLEQHAPLKQLMGVLTRTASFKELQIAARANTGSQTKMAKWLRYAVDPKELLARSIERATAKLAGRAQPNYGDANVYTLLTDAEIDAIIPYVRSYFQSLSVGSVLSENRQPESGGAVGQGRGTTGPDEVSGRSVGTAGIGDSGGIGDEVARSTPAPNETQSRFASPNEAARVINGPRTDAMVAEQAQRWLDSVDTQTAVEQFVAQAVPLPLDAAEHAAALLISRLTSESTAASTEVQRLWAHVQGQRMARVWTREFLSADPARALRQRGVVNNTILQPIAPVMAAQGILVDRADAVMDKRFEGGGAGAVEKVTKIVKKVDTQTGTDVAADLDADTEGSAGTPTRPNPRKGAVKAKHPNLKKLLDALRKKMLPGMTWADIFMDLPSTQKERQRQIYARLLKDDRLRNLNADERLALTNELDKAWQRERRKVFNKELEKAGVIGEKDKTDRVKVQKALPKLLRMINLGMFNSEMWREAVAPEYGLRMLTAADTAQLRTLAEAAWKLPEGVIRNQKLRDVLNAIQKKTGASWIELLNSYWTAAVLSGLRTQFDTYMAAINGMGTNLMQIGGLIARGQGRAAIDAHAQWWRGLMEGVRESGQILFKGDTSYLKRFGADLKKALEGETSVTPVPLGENLWKNGNTFQKYGLAPVMMFTGRLMAAADHINNTATTQGAIAVARALHPELYQGKVGFTVSERADARTQALREVTGGTAPKTGQERATVSARTREILNGTVKPADYAAASEIGDMAAYQNDPDPTGIFGIVHSAMKQGLGSIQRGLGDYAQDVTANRFARVISGLMAGSLHGITGTRFMRFGANFGADLTRYIPGSYVLGKAGFYGRDVSRMQQELLLGKNLVGLMLASTLAAIFLNSDDEDEGWQIEGDWSTLNPQQAKERMAAGYERLTMWKRDGDKVRRVSYKQWPTMGLFAVVGGMLDEKRHKPASWAEHGTAGHLLRGVATGYVQVKNVSAVRNLVELFGEPSFSADAVTSTLDQMIKTGTNFAGGFMPTLIKDAETWTDPRNFKPEGAAELMLRSMPIARKFVNDGRPQLNLLGEEVKLQRAPYSRSYTSVESGEAHRVLGALLARGLTLPMPSDQVTVTKDNVRVPLETLGRDAVWRYEKAVGQGYKDWLSLEGSDLLKLPVQEADARIKARSAAIKARAKASVVK